MGSLWLLVLFSLAAPASSFLKLRKYRHFDVYYVNMAQSTARRKTMEEHLHHLGVQPTRVEGINFDATRSGTFSEMDKATLGLAYSSWNCGPWPCAMGDQVCCWGFDDAVKFTEHTTSARPGLIDKVRASKFLAASTIKVLVMKEIRDRCLHDHTKCQPAVLLEDDAVLEANWEDRVQLALKAFGADGFDLIKLYGWQPGPADCYQQCDPGATQCFVKNTPNCQQWSGAALLVNPRAVDKVLIAIEAFVQGVTASVRHGYRISTAEVDRMRFDFDNWVTLGTSSINVYTARPTIASLDKQTSFNTSFQHFIEERALANWSVSNVPVSRHL